MEILNLFSLIKFLSFKLNAKFVQAYTIGTVQVQKFKYCSLKCPSSRPPPPPKKNLSDKKSHFDVQDIPRVFDAKEQGLDPSFRLTRYANVKVGHPS
jgi:hypothetical protein